MITRMLSTGSASACLVAAAVFSAPVLAEAWQPQSESPKWAKVRQELTLAGDLPSKPWVFMEGLHTPAIRAAEYLGDPARTSLGVEFDGALLLQKKEAVDWQVRLVRMRALCNQRRLQRLSAKGVWLDYIGRDDTSARAQWICGLAL